MIFDVDKKPGRFSYDYGQEYDKMIKEIMMAFGTMRSARDKKLFNTYEFVYELLGQYIINGKITFNEEVPKSIKTGHTWGRPNYKYSWIRDDEISRDHVKDYVEHIASKLTHECDVVLGNCVNRIFVM